MSKQLIINMPVQNTEASKAFFTTVNFKLNEALTDEHATCFNIEDNLIIALLPVTHFKETLMGNEVADARTTNEMHLAIGAINRDEVDQIVTNAVKAGAKELHEPVEAGTVYGRSFADLDGHRWNVFYMSTPEQ